MSLSDAWRARRAAPRPRRHGLPLLTVMVALGAALAVMPARWLMRLGDEHSLVAIVDASGTLWDGAALLAVGPPGARRTLPQPLNWRWTWHGIVIRHPWLAGPTRLSLALRGLAMPSFSLTAQTLRVPADLLAALGAPMNTLAPAGALEIRWPDYQAGAARAPVLWQAEWRDASSALSPVHPLGSYRLQATADNGNHSSNSNSGSNNGGSNNGGNSSGNSGSAAAPRLRLLLTTLSGPLQVRASGTWNGRALNLSGTAEPAAGTPDNVCDGLDALLSALGRRNGAQSIFSTR